MPSVQEQYDIALKILENQAHFEPEDLEEIGMAITLKATKSAGKTGIKEDDLHTLLDWVGGVLHEFSCIALALKYPEVQLGLKDGKPALRHE